jgi:hypothetical protein
MHIVISEVEVIYFIGSHRSKAPLITSLAVLLSEIPTEMPEDQTPSFRGQVPNSWRGTIKMRFHFYAKEKSGLQVDDYAKVNV